MALPGMPIAGQAQWAVVTDGQVSYTNDAFQFSSARRARFSEDPSLPTFVPLDKPEDVIWEPAVEVIRKFRPALGATEFSVKAHGFIYTNNPIFNHADYRVQARQAFSSQTQLLLRYRYLPNLFLGPNFERRTGERLIEGERVTSHTWRAELEHRLTEAWSVTLISRYGLRLFNDAFAERDTRFWTAGPLLAWMMTPWITAILGYLYERGLADGQGDTRFNDDISYRQHAVTAGADIRLIRPLTLHLLYVYRLKGFTSDLVGDTHLNRQDQTHQGTAEFRYRLTAASSVFVSFQRTQRSSTAETRSFTDTIVSVGGEHRF